MTAIDLTKPRNLDAIDALHEHALQLAAMLRLTHGQSGETFRNQPDKTQDAYHWTCSNLADEIQQLAEHL